MISSTGPAPGLGGGGSPKAEVLTLLSGLLRGCCDACHRRAKRGNKIRPRDQEGAARERSERTEAACPRTPGRAEPYGLEQLDQISGNYKTRERFLTELTLDPPNATGDLAGPPLLDEDYLILSTIHSAKGQEWDAVYLLNCADGCMPSDMATGDPEQIEEERRLLYVAMTRARSQLHVVHPLRFFVRTQHRHGDKHLFAPLSRFLPASTHRHFERTSVGRGSTTDGAALTVTKPLDVAKRLREMW